MRLKRLVIRIVGVVLPVCLLAGGAALAPERAASLAAREPGARNALDVALGRTKSFAFKAPISPAVSQMLLDQTGALNRRAAQSGVQPKPIVLPSGSGGCNSAFEGNDQVNVRVNQDCSLRAARDLAGDRPDEPGPGSSSPRTTRASASTTAARLRAPTAAAVGRPDSAVLAVHAARRTYGRRLRGSDGHVGLAGELVRRRNAERVSSALGLDSARRGEVRRGHRGCVLPLDGPHGGFQEYRSLPLGVASNVNDPNVSLDKPMIVADANPTSPKRDNVYLTWTRYGPRDRATGRRAFERSAHLLQPVADGGANWTLPIEISGRNFDLCPTVRVLRRPGLGHGRRPDGSLYARSRTATRRTSPSSSSS